MKLYLLSLFLLSLTFGGILQAQPSSCSQPSPLQGYRQKWPARKTIDFDLILQYNSQDKLVSDVLSFDNETRSRSTHAAILRIGYAVTDRFAFNIAASVIQKKRSISYLIFLNDRLVTRGIGDPEILARYRLLGSNETEHQLILGAGAKLPVGRFDLHSDEIAIAEDMQPGSGALDWLVYGYASTKLAHDMKRTAGLEFIYRFTGENSDGYEFGDVMNVTGSVSYDSAKKYVLAGRLRYRRAAANSDTDGRTVANSGGDWLYLSGGIDYRLNPLLTAGLDVDLPLIAKLNGTQFSTGYIVSFSIFYRLGL